MHFPLFSQASIRFGRYYTLEKSLDNEESLSVALGAIDKDRPHQALALGRWVIGAIQKAVGADRPHQASASGYWFQECGDRFQIIVKDQYDELFQEKFFQNRKQLFQKYEDKRDSAWRGLKESLLCKYTNTPISNEKFNLLLALFKRFDVQDKANLIPALAGRSVEELETIQRQLEGGMKPNEWIRRGEIAKFIATDHKYFVWNETPISQTSLFEEQETIQKTLEATAKHPPKKGFETGVVLLGKPYSYTIEELKALNSLGTQLPKGTTVAMVKTGDCSGGDPELNYCTNWEVAINTKQGKEFCGTCLLSPPEIVNAILGIAKRIQEPKASQEGLVGQVSQSP